ncbi:hypothetical protein CUMW_193890 [Citrus unshiu]|uniref:Uncharacterized protein n=1 Tax=Citrus unshiu TaxID=55188 RepID=A0A2H5Q4Z2_CITUN|nr:hypothetical protein CUMW_193890 [Citrus unshiu]
MYYMENCYNHTLHNFPLTQNLLVINFKVQSPMDLKTCHPLDILIYLTINSILQYLSGFPGLIVLSTISSGLGNLTSLKHSISYNVLEGKLPTSFGRLREPRSISLSWANKSQEILEIFHSFSRGMFDGLEESYVVDCQIFDAPKCDAEIRFSSVTTQDLCSINFPRARRAPSNVLLQISLPQQTKSEYVRYVPGANPPTLKSDNKVRGTLPRGKRGCSLALVRSCVFTPRLGKGAAVVFCEILRVTPRFREKAWLSGSVRSCVLRHGSGESVLVGLDLGLRACLANCLDRVSLAYRPLPEWPYASYRKCLADDTSWTNRIFPAPVLRAPSCLRNHTWSQNSAIRYLLSSWSP